MRTCSICRCPLPRRNPELKGLGLCFQCGQVKADRHRNYILDRRFFHADKMDSIAIDLGLSPKTVSYYWQQLRQKIRMSSDSWMVARQGV